MRAPALLAAALSLAALPALADDEVGVGLPAPGFGPLKTLNPESSKLAQVSLDDFVGSEPTDEGARVVLLSFFASWCGPCKKEMPYLEKLHQKYKDQGLRVISVDIDKEPAGIEAAKKLAAANEVTFPVASDRFQFVARSYLGDRSPLPSVFIILRDGTIARIEKGYGKDASTFLAAEVQKALRAAKAEPPAKGE